MRAPQYLTDYIADLTNDHCHADDAPNMQLLDAMCNRSGQQFTCHGVLNEDCNIEAQGVICISQMPSFNELHTFTSTLYIVEHGKPAYRIIHKTPIDPDGDFDSKVIITNISSTTMTELIDLLRHNVVFYQAGTEAAYKSALSVCEEQTILLNQLANDQEVLI